MFLIDMINKKMKLPSVAEALPGRKEPLPTADTHFVNGHLLKGPWPDHLETAMFGMGCFWGVERLFWRVPGVYVTASGYAGGITPNPTYQETCTGLTGHNEVVLVVFDPHAVSYMQLLTLFWEGHNPTQGMRQGSNIGTTYRSGIYTVSPEQDIAAKTSRDNYQRALDQAGHSRITTEITGAPEFFYAEEYHQQYLAKNPAGYCSLRGTGIACPIPQVKSD